MFKVGDKVKCIYNQSVPFESDVEYIVDRTQWVGDVLYLGIEGVEEIVLSYRFKKVDPIAVGDWVQIKEKDTRFCLTELVQYRVLDITESGESIMIKDNNKEECWLNSDSVHKVETSDIPTVPQPKEENEERFEFEAKNSAEYSLKQINLLAGFLASQVKDLSQEPLSPLKSTKDIQKHTKHLQDEIRVRDNIILKLKDVAEFYASTGNWYPLDKDPFGNRCIKNDDIYEHLTERGDEEFGGRRARQVLDELRMSEIFMTAPLVEDVKINPKTHDFIKRSHERALDRNLQLEKELEAEKTKNFFITQAVKDFLKEFKREDMGPELAQLVLSVWNNEDA